MNKFTASRLLAVLLFTFYSALQIVAASAEEAWLIAKPEEVGIESAPLAEMIDFARDRHIPVHSVQIVRHSKLVFDAYFYPYRPGMRHDVASVTKSITSTLIGIALDKHHLRSVNQTLTDLFPPPTSEPTDARKKAITLRHLLTMQAGWDCGFEPNEARLFEMRRSGDWPQFMLNLPMIAEPGTRWAYCSGNCHLLSAIITQSVGTNALVFARQTLFEPLGIRDVMWPSDSQGNNHGWGDLQLHPRDMAKIGQLFLQQGRWGNRQIISKEWIAEATRAHVDRTINADHYGYFWWVKGTNFPGMFEAVGRGGQRITVWPKEQLVVVFTGGDFEPGDLAPFILRALKPEKSLAPNANATARLQEKLLAAARAPLAKPIAPLPKLATDVSGKRFQLSANGLDLTELSLHFEKSETALRLVRNGETLSCAVGLDDVERFSTDLLVGLPFAAKGNWTDPQSFLLQIDRVGGINRYELAFRFEADAKSFTATLKEHTGLNNETIIGKAIP